MIGTESAIHRAFSAKGPGKINKPAAVMKIEEIRDQKIMLLNRGLFHENIPSAKSAITASEICIMPIIFFLLYFFGQHQSQANYQGKLSAVNVLGGEISHYK